MKKNRLFSVQNSDFIKKIQFFSKVVPTLTDGDYTISIDNTINFDNQSKDFNKVQHFSVQGCRFKLENSDIHSIYPANESIGKYQDILPQIVFNKRSLPWENTISTTDNTNSTWFALLVFDEDELLLKNYTQPADKNKSINQPLKNIRNIELNGIIGPKIENLYYKQSDDDLVQSIDISKDTFKKIVPRFDELPYLTHTRQVCMQDKEIVDASKNFGWYSVSIANRLISSTKKQIVHLVSLEGFEKFIKDFDSIPSDCTTIRLISLYSWSFSNTFNSSKNKNFSNIMLNLLSQKSDMNTDLLLRFPYDKSNKEISNQDIVTKALDAGYIPTNYYTKDTNNTFAWYRGPCTPLKSNRFTKSNNIEAFTKASEAIIYDKDTGIFNMSYSSAWQLGKMLALSDNTFSQSLIRWRSNSNRFIDLLATRAKIDNLPNLVTENIDELHEWLNSKIVTHSCMDYLLNDFAKSIESKNNSNGTLKSPPSLRANRDDLVDELKKVMSDPNGAKLITQLGGQDFNDIVEWIAYKSLLYNIPLSYIIPNEQMLPTESIRFFYIDRAWTDSLIDGAMSIAIHSTKDSDYYKASKNIITDAVNKLIMQLRDKLLGKDTETELSQDYYMSGFLLRSSVVRDWSGLEIRAYSSIDKNSDGVPIGKDSIKLIRMERLSKDLMLCIFPNIPTWIEFDEPKESMRFGVEKHDSDDEIYIRDHDSGKINGTTYTLNNSDYRDFTSRVLNISSLTKNIAQASNINSLSSADFALQMVKVPEKMVFANDDL
jgi:hypothetical protein